MSRPQQLRSCFRRFHLRIEALEDRQLLAANLFVDFGDNFPGGTLTTTQGAFRDVADDPVPANRILGTTLEDSAGGFNAGTQLDIVAQTFTATERAQMMAVVERAYEPLDVDVIELTATAQTTPDGRNVAGAASMADVINTLRAGLAALRDAYIFVGTFIVDPGGPNEETYTGGGGLSPSSPVLGEQSDLSSASNTHDDVAVVYSDGGFSNNTLNNMSHEAGHLFGLRHSITNPAISATTNLFHQAEIMSYRNTNATTSSMFTRYPMIRGDGNSPGFRIDATIDATARTITRAAGDFTTAGLVAGQQILLTSAGANNGVFTIQSIAATVLTLTAAGTLTDDMQNIRISWGPLNYNDLSARNSEVTIHDQLRMDGNVLAEPGITFVSGTGAHDIITITRNGANADVDVQAFADMAYTTPITVPGEADSTYSYSIPLTDTILVHAGDSNDRIVVDGDLGVDVRVDGMLGNDTLVVNGKGAANATYTPNATAPVGVDIVNDFGGTVAIGGNTIIFNNFETAGSARIENVNTVTYAAPPAGNDDLVFNNSSGGDPQVTGTVNSGTSVVPLRLQSVNRLAVDTGAGADTLTVDLGNGNPIPAGALSFDGGVGTDTLEIQGATNITYTPTPPANDPAEGTLDVDGSSIEFSNTEFVTPVAPDITGLSLSSNSIDENESVTLSGTFIDPGSLSTHSVTVNWGDGNSDIFSLATGARSFSKTHQYKDDGPSPGNNTSQDDYDVTVTISDNDSLQDVSVTEVTVKNVDPVIETSNNSSPSGDKVKEGETVTVFGTFSDVGTLDEHTVEIDWGDSTTNAATVDQLANTFTGGHAYAAGGIYTVTITLMDDDLGVDTIVETVFVSGAGVQTVDGKEVLFVIGTNDADHVTINETGQNTLEVHADFLPDQGQMRSFSGAIDEIRIILCDGDDHASIAGNVPITALLDGGEGADHLKAGGAGSVLIGGAGPDTIIGGRGRDLLIGGDDADRLVGSVGEDILIGDLTAFTDGADDDKLANDAALLSMLAEWNSDRDQETRMSNLSGIANPEFGDRLNGDNFLKINDTVVDDGDADVLTGSAGRDWFWAFPNDVLSDFHDGKDEETS